MRRAALIAALALTAVVATACSTQGVEHAVASPSASPTASAPTPDVATDGPVAVSPPLRLSVPSAGIDGAVEEYTAEQAEADGGIDPPTLESIAWYSGVQGGIPGSDATNTVYLFGHAWSEPAVFNGLRQLAPGDTAVVTTATGTLTYQVDETVTMDKSDFSSDPTVSSIVPGRLVLVSCYRTADLDPASSASENIAVILHLVSSAPA